MKEDEILSAITGKLRDAVQFSNSNIANKQEAALKYYKRAFLPGDDKLRGRSRWVSPEVMQRVDWSTSQLCRIFDAPENVCEFLPFGPEDEAIAKQQTNVVNWVLKTRNSHMAFLQPWLFNGLTTGLGILTVEFTAETREGLAQIVKGVPNEQLVAFNAQEEAGQIVIEQAGKPRNQMGIEVRDLKIRAVRKLPRFDVLSVAPEDFIVSKDAKFSSEGGIDARVQGHRKLVRRDDLLSMGFDADKVKSIPQATDKTDGIALERSKDIDGHSGASPEDVECYQIYTRMKIDGKPRNYRFTLAGDYNSPVLLDYEETSAYAPYAPFVPFPVADTLFGSGIPDKIGDDHLLITRMTRAMLDSLHHAVHPIKVVNPDSTNLDDLLNVQPGSVVRSTDPTAGISYTSPPFAGSAAMPVLQQLSASLDYSTGVGPSMTSIDASDLARVSATAATTRNNASQLLVEMVSRWLADTGYRYLVKLVVDQLIQKPEDAQLLISRLTNNYVPIEEFSPEADVTTSVAFGVMSRDMASAQLTNLLAQQMQAIQAGLPVANAQNVYATLAKLAETAGFKNTAAFFTDPSSLPPSPPPAPPVDPNAGLIQVETTKAQLKAQSDEASRQFEMQKLVAQMQNQQEEFRAEMELKRQELAQEFELKSRELELRYGPKSIVNIDQPQYI